jgi:hypothetical protein
LAGITLDPAADARGGKSPAPLVLPGRYGGGSLPSPAAAPGALAAGYVLPLVGGAGTAGGAE